MSDDNAREARLRRLCELLHADDADGRFVAAHVAWLERLGVPGTHREHAAWYRRPAAWSIEEEERERATAVVRLAAAGDWVPSADLTEFLAASPSPPVRQLAFELTPYLVVTEER